MAYIYLCLHVYSWWLVKINMFVPLRAVTFPLFNSNGMYAVITIVLRVFFIIIINIKQVESFKQVQTFPKFSK